MRFKLRHADANFAGNARKQFTYDFTIGASSERVFDTVVHPERMDRWLPDLRAARWLTPEPHGVESLREIRLPWLRVEEKVLVWERGERFVFRIAATSIPMLRRMVEDFRFTRLGPSKTRVQWTIAYQPARLFIPLEGLIYPRYSRLFEEACRRLRSHLEATS